MRYTIELDPHQIYSLLSKFILIVLAISLIVFFLIKKNLHLKFLNKFYHFLFSNRKRVRISVLIFSIILILIFFVINYKIDVLEKSTSVNIDEKIVIIEIDDYWNIEEEGAGPYFERYGYTMKDYKEVSDVIDKHGFVASLGVTPYIFVEELRENFALEDDGEMIAYLRELDSKGYELAMHGYNHCRNTNYCPKYEEVWFNVFNGKAELENIFGKSFVTYFPPGNTWTTEQYENVKRAGFLVVGNTHVPKAYFDEEVIITPKGYDPIYVYNWYALDFKHTSYNEWIEEYNKTNLFLLQLHCNTFDSQEKLNDLDIFLKYIKEDGAKVMTYKDFHQYIKDKKESKGLSGNIIIET
ncbi:DUF2334 domain-containing protein [Nanoarchaeota archaeon]